MTKARPTLLMIAGPNGSGKSTLTEHLRQRGVDFGEYINPDEIALTLPGPPSEEKSWAAQAEADRRRQACLEACRSFSFETVMSHPSKIEILHIGRRLGFEIALFFVAVENPSISISRVAARVAAGGHDVPEQRIIDRFARTMAALPAAVAAADRSVIFDNTGSSIASDQTLRPVVEFRRGEDGRIELVRAARLLPAWVTRHLKRYLGRNPKRTGAQYGENRGRKS